jgi:DNA-directed RNA polymerase beta subunit
MLARMNVGQLYEMYCGLMGKELGTLIQKVNKSEFIKMVKNVYINLDQSPNKKATEIMISNLEKLPNSKYEQMVTQVKQTGFYPIIIPPFKAPKHTDIRKSLKALNLEPSYHLSLPEYNTKTDKPVPVGYMYIGKLEHMGDAKIYGRSTGPVAGKTGQPTAGKRREGGQRMGELDSYAYISYNCPSVLAEFMGPLSDDYVKKEEILAEIIQTGSAGYREPKSSPARELLNSYFISLMLTRD